MRNSLIISEFEFCYTTSFKHTARVKYNVTFDNSSFGHIIQKLGELKQNINEGIKNEVHVGYDFGIQEVQHIDNLLRQIAERYHQLYNSQPPATKKIYQVFDQLRKLDSQTPEEIAKDVLNVIVTPTPSKNQTKKDKINTEAEALSKKRALEMLKKSKRK